MAGVVSIVESRDKPDLQAKLRDVPHLPGVYLMRDRFGKVIYVGKARDLRKRLASYFTPSRLRRADLKTRSLIQSIWSFDLHTVRNETEALLLEGKLIKEFRPRYNVSFRDDKRFLLLKVKLDDPFPRFQLSRLRKDDGARYFGPFAHAGALRTTVAWLNREFGLRNCRPLRPGEHDYRHCSNDIIRNCSAPCIGRIDEAGYRARMLEACRVLEGRSKEALAKLEADMREAAEALDFERAAALRDVLEDLRRTVKPVRSFTRGRGAPRVGEGIDPLADVEELRQLLHLPAAPMLMECFDISNISNNHCVASMVRFRNGVPDSASYRRYRIRTVKGQDDFASMAEVVRRRYSRILLETRDAAGEAMEGSQESIYEALQRVNAELDQEPAPDDSAGPDPAATAGPRAGRGRKPVRIPDLVIVDGGKGQLSAACAELQRLGLWDLPIIGLAKRQEEIFRPGADAPLVLSHDTGALQLLQRIRDEAHRFANGYHQLLMKRRVQESLLDDCPGVSARRKQLLLKEFGSIARLRRTPEAAIAAVKGIGPALAAEIVRFLERSR